MSNPWMKKNPFMSMWLSGANAIAGSARNHAKAQAKRQVASTAKAATDALVDFWTGAPARPPACSTSKKTRR